MKLGHDATFKDCKTHKDGLWNSKINKNNSLKGESRQNRVRSSAIPVNQPRLRELSGEKDSQKAEESVETAVLKDSFATLEATLQQTQRKLQLERVKGNKGFAGDEKVVVLEKDLEGERERSRKLEEKLAKLMSVIVE